MNRLSSRGLTGVAALVALVLGFMLYTAHPVRSSDHLDSSTTVNRPGADITDAYLFPSKQNANNVVLVMNVHPNIPTGQGTSTFFDPGVLYQMKIDNSGAATPKENLVIQFLFDNPTSSSQTYTIYGPAAPVQIGNINKVLAKSSGTGTINQATTTSNGMQVFAGGRQDPFFFDVAQFQKIIPDRNQGSTATGCLPNAPTPAPLPSGATPSPAPSSPPFFGNATCVGFNPPGTATNAYANVNVLSIVVELPKSALTQGGTSKIAYWVTTSTTSGL